MLHQLMVLTQINCSQYVLIKLPRNDGIFDRDLVQELNRYFANLGRKECGEILSCSVQCESEVLCTTNTTPLLEE
jgi:hypothetical protein